MPGHGFNRFDSAPAMFVVGIRRQHSMAEAHRTVPLQWADFRELDIDGGRVLGAYCGMSSDGFEYMTGREVRGFDVAPVLDRMRIPAQSYAVFRHETGIAEIGSTWDSIWRDWLPRSGYEDAETPPFELYDSSFSPDTGTCGLEIWFPVRRRG